MTDFKTFAYTFLKIYFDFFWYQWIKVDLNRMPRVRQWYIFYFWNLDSGTPLFLRRWLSIKNRFLRMWTGMSVNIAHDSVSWVRSHQTVQIRAFVYSRRVSLSMKIVQCLEKGFSKLAIDFQNVLDSSPVNTYLVYIGSGFPIFPRLTGLLPRIPDLERIMLSLLILLWVYIKLTKCDKK